MAVLVMSLLAACGEQAGAPRAEDPEQREGVGGTYSADGLPDWARGVERIGLELTRDQLRFSAGCNQFSGPVRWGVDGAFEAGPLSGTEMGCEPQAMRVDARLADFFQRADRLRLDGNDIEIRAGDEGIWFVPTSDQPGQQPAAVDLEGTTWNLTGIGEYDGDVGSMSSVPEGVESFLRIQDGELRFHDGCNSGFGEVRVDGDVLVLDGVGGTLMACGGPSGDVADGVRRVVRDGRITWSIGGKHLVLHSEDRRFQLDYEAE